MRKVQLIICAIIFLCHFSKAEGTRELAPNPQININGSLTNDIAGMYINEPRYNDFASYGNNNPLSRLHINIQDPNTECIYLGFSIGTQNMTGQNAPLVNFEYRIKDPNGNIVFGPIQISPGNAQITDWSSAYGGPQQIFGPTGYPATLIPSNALTSQGWTGKGDYYIEFVSLGASSVFIINYWDITVANCSGGNPKEKKGRLWSNNWALFAINDYGFPERPFNGKFFVCAPDPSNPNASFVTEVDFNGSGFRPAAFNVAFNSFGVSNTGNISEDRKSVPGINSATPVYSIFLNDPVDICEAAEPGEVELTGISRCGISDFCIKFKTTKQGQLDILLDFDGPDGVYTPGTADVIISTNILASQVNKATCLDWDGLDGLGNRLPETVQTEIPIVISYAQGIYHFPIYDAELLTDGFKIQAVRPPGPSPLLFYDDSNILTPSGSGEPQIQLNGCTLPCHAWTNYGLGQPGFGDLNTINSWWFSNQSITQAVFNLPGYYDCSVENTALLCPNDSGFAKVNLIIFPPDASSLQVISRSWSGPGIVSGNQTDSIRINEDGTYSVEIAYINATGDTCRTHCSGTVHLGQQTTISIDTLIVKGDTVDINGEKYTEAGRYTQLITSLEACDTLVHILVKVAQTTIYYDFNDCKSVKSDSSHADFTEFVVKYPDPLSCADISAEFLHRENPFVNPHSCTPGVMNSNAMCVGSLDSCDYDPGNQKSIIFEVSVDPQPDTAILITRLSFYERAPEMFDWIGGLDGPNNYPTEYGVRILKNGIEIFRQEGISTTRDWTKESFELASIPELLIEEKAILRFELLGYCLITDTIDVNAWDIDELTVAMACAPTSSNSPSIHGEVLTINGLPLSGIDVLLSHRKDFSQVQRTVSGHKGQYAFNPLFIQENIYLKASGPSDYLNGVSTKDVILLFRHLLGRPFFQYFDQIPAGDVDGNDVIDVRDVSQLRKLILGKINRFDNDSWAFGLVRRNPIDDSQFFMKTMISTYKPGSNHVENITGIKVGDVDRSVIPGLITPNKTRSNEIINLVIEDIDLEMGEVYTIDIKIESSVDLEGFQLFFSGQNIYFNDVNSSLTYFGNQNFNLVGDKISISWNGQYPSTKACILTLKFKALQGGSLSDALALHIDKNSEGYIGEDLDEKPLSIKWLKKQRFTKSIPDRMNIFPNPSNDGRFIYRGSGEINKIKVYSLDGRNIFIDQISTDEIRINKKGIFLMSFTMNGKPHVKTLIVQ